MPFIYPANRTEPLLKYSITSSHNRLMQEPGFEEDKSLLAKIKSLNKYVFIESLNLTLTLEVSMVQFCGVKPFFYKSDTI